MDNKGLWHLKGSENTRIVNLILNIYKIKNTYPNSEIEALEISIPTK